MTFNYHNKNDIFGPNGAVERISDKTVPLKGTVFVDSNGDAYIIEGVAIREADLEVMIFYEVKPSKNQFYQCQRLKYWANFLVFPYMNELVVKTKDLESLTDKELPMKTETYQHYKGDTYEIINHAVESYDCTHFIIYKDKNNEYPFNWCRPLYQWSEIVELYGKKIKRFTKL